jgi:uncharacterized membrane protein
MDSFGFKLFFLLHIFAMIVAFAPTIVWPLVSVRLKKEGKPVGPTIGALAEGNTVKIHGPALALTGLFGFGLIGMSDKHFEFSQAWVSLAMVLWFGMLGVMFGLMAPAEKKAHTGDAAAEKQLSMFGGILHLLLLLMVIDMVWKPGL